MSSISSRFSTLTSASSKAYQPPKPTYQSPKLVHGSPSAATLPQDLSRIAHPFANASYATPRCAPSPPNHLDPSSVHQHAPSHISSISQFGSIHSDFDPSISAERPASAGPYDSAILRPRRERSNTVESVRSACPEYCPPTEVLHSPNPFKSQFDDSDDEEERLDFAIQSLAGVSNRARLAAIGTASRLFKGRRHSRTSSKTIHLDHDLPPHLLDKRASQARSPPAARPCTSDGMSPVPRQAVFGHRPSPSELSFATRREPNRNVAPADRDLILALQGGGPKLRNKQTDKKKSLPKSEPPPDQDHPSHTRQASVNISAPIPDSRSHWTAEPPPYCAPSELDLGRRESLRKSQSLSTLRFGFNRRPSSGSCAALPEPRSQRTCDPAERPALTSEQSAWESMLTNSPSSVSEHGSLASSLGRVSRSEASPQTPSKRLAKANRLPPQKPPPQSDLPAPPTSQPFAASTKSSSEDERPCPSSADESIGGARQDKIYTLHNSVQASLDVSSKSSAPSTPPKSPPQLGRSRQPDHQSQVILDIGGTKFVTLVSTLQGAPGDQPRLLELLQQHDDEAALCSNAQLTRRRRVESSSRQTGNGEQWNGNSGAQRSPVQAAERPMLSIATTSSDTSISTLSSYSSNSSPRNSFTRQTSDRSDHSSWSQHTPGRHLPPPTPRHGRSLSIETAISTVTFSTFSERPNCRTGCRRRVCRTATRRC